MRVQIHIDGASTAAVRELSAALAGIGKRESLAVGCDGPEKWTATTPMLSANEHAFVVARLIRFHGETIADTLLSR